MISNIQNVIFVEREKSYKWMSSNRDFKNFLGENELLVVLQISENSNLKWNRAISILNKEQIEEINVSSFFVEPNLNQLHLNDDYIKYIEEIIKKYKSIENIGFIFIDMAEICKLMKARNLNVPIINVSNMSNKINYSRNLLDKERHNLSFRNKNNKRNNKVGLKENNDKNEEDDTPAYLKRQKAREQKELEKKKKQENKNIQEEKVELNSKIQNKDTNSKTKNENQNHNQKESKLEDNLKVKQDNQINQINQNKDSFNNDNSPNKDEDQNSKKGTTKDEKFNPTDAMVDDVYDAVQSFATNTNKVASETQNNQTSSNSNNKTNQDTKGDKGKKTGSEKNDKKDNQVDDANKNQKSVLETIAEIEREIFGQRATNTELERVYTDLDDEKAKLIDMVFQRLKTSINKYVSAETDTKEVTESVYISLIMAILKSNDYEDFNESWRAIGGNKLDVCLNDERYVFIKDEAIYYANLCEMLYDGDKWA